MDKFNRRHFLFNAGAVIGIPLLTALIKPEDIHPLFSFSTLGCPDWDFKKILDFASKHGYNGIEIRGIQRELDITKSIVFKDAASRKQAVSMMKDKALKFVCLGSSAELHHREGADREKNLDEARRFIDLASEIGCPYVRVFPNKLIPGEDKNKTMERIAKGLSQLGAYSSESNVTVLMETHGDLSHSDDVEKIMQWANHNHTGLVWDIANMWSVTQESPADVYGKLKKYIHHTHIKNGKLGNGKFDLTLIGIGDVPLGEAIGALQKGNYKGFYCFEWEKLWHPEIEAPEIALADFPISVKRYFGKKY
jgi:sugar phosphate isomerase/epimerase